MKKWPLLLLLFTFFACHTKKVTSVDLSLIPLPSDMIHVDNYTDISDFHVSVVDFVTLGQFLPWIETFATVHKTEAQKSNITLTLVERLKPETYSLHIAADEISILYKDKQSLRNAFSTIAQLKALNNGKIPITKISQDVQFSYRGMHLDVGRHMFPVEDIKKYIDYLTFYNYNKFHWHLTEDQGWRIEIKKYPKLQDIAAYRDETLVGHYNDQPHQYDGQRYGGFYTQEDVREIVSYAAARGIDVIPEIEMPGHSQAAISAYPFLSCPQETTSVATKWGVFNQVYCPTEETFIFLENVLDEVIDMFPYDYIHIGGDECPKEQWKESAFCQNLIKEKKLENEEGLQGYFITRMAEYLRSKGKTIIGWDEILEGELHQDAVVMSWRGETGGIHAAKEGHKVIMTPGSHCYFDHYQSTSLQEPIAIGGYTSVEKVYNYEVIPNELSGGEEQNLVWGAQGNVWTEYMPTFRNVEYMSLARMAALSEVLHRAKTERNYIDFQKRLTQHIKYWKSQNVHIADHQLDVKTEVSPLPSGHVLAVVTADYPDADIRLIDPQNSQRGASNGKFELDKSGKYEIFATADGRLGASSFLNLDLHKGIQAEIKLSTKPSDQYAGTGPTSIINGIEGSNTKYGGPEWLGFSGDDFDATLTWKIAEQVESISLKFYNGEGQWIYLPSQIEVSYSVDGKNYDMIPSVDMAKSEEKIARVHIPLEKQIMGLKIKAVNYGIIPDGKQGAGHRSWLFVDEIIID